MTLAPSWKPHYSRFLEAHGDLLHLCAHSHHFWLDRTRDAQLEAWDDAARLSDRKWDRVLGEVLPDVQARLAARLGVSHPERLSFAGNTHEFFVRLLSCFDEKRPLRVLSTDSEFHSFRRQATRLKESGEIHLETVAQFPRETFSERFAQTASSGSFDMVFVSHVFFDSGGVLPEAEKLLRELATTCRMLVLDTYHSFLARPFSLRGLENDIFVVGGAYKYAQAGEGACFLYTPPKAEALRPKFTGWYAHFAALSAPPSSQLCGYGEGAWRFWGSTFDPSALYRLRAVLAFLDHEGLTGEKLHQHSLALQEGCLERLRKLQAREEWQRRLQSAAEGVVEARDRGNFLSFKLPSGQGAEIQKHLGQRKILSDSRETAHGSFLRFGFGLYHDATDLERFSDLMES